jgi:hypothetical protein
MRPSLRPARSPCSRLYARPADRVAARRWWALTPPFHPLPASRLRLLAGLLSVAVVVTLRTACPHLLFREATLPIQPDGLGVGKFLCPENRPATDPLVCCYPTGIYDCTPVFKRTLTDARRPQPGRRPRQDSNLRPQRPQRCALSPELRGRITWYPPGREDYSTIPRPCQCRLALWSGPG